MKHFIALSILSLCALASCAAPSSSGSAPSNPSVESALLYLASSAPLPSEQPFFLLSAGELASKAAEDGYSFLLNEKIQENPFGESALLVAAPKRSSSLSGWGIDGVSVEGDKVAIRLFAEIPEAQDTDLRSEVFVLSMPQSSVPDLPFFDVSIRSV